MKNSSEHPTATTKNTMKGQWNGKLIRGKQGGSYHRIAMIFNSDATDIHHPKIRFSQIILPKTLSLRPGFRHITQYHIHQAETRSRIRILARSVRRMVMFRHINVPHLRANHRGIRDGTTAQGISEVVLYSVLGAFGEEVALHGGGTLRGWTGKNIDSQDAAVGLCFGDGDLSPGSWCEALN